MPDTSGWLLERKIFHPNLPVSSKPLLQFNSGFINYEFTYRSGLDTPFIEKHISQHLITGSSNVTIAQKIPFRITFFDRESKSIYLKSYRSITANFDVQNYQRLKALHAGNNFKNYAQQLSDPLLKLQKETCELKLNNIKNLLSDPEIIKKLIEAKETIAREDFKDTTTAFKDSVKQIASAFINFYESFKKDEIKFSHLYDSLQMAQQKEQQRLKRLEQLLNGKRLTEFEMQELGKIYGKKNKHLTRLLNAYDGIRVLSIGRTTPNFSPLTVQNVNVNGLNFEYNRNQVYFAATAGGVDIFIRDFFYKDNKRIPQNVYALRTGYGDINKNNIILTYYAGKKQLFGGEFLRSSNPIKGVSLSTQLMVNKYTKLYGEIAQSAISYKNATGNISKTKLNFNDHTQQAYAIGLKSYIPYTKTRLDAGYQHNGLNFQSFTGFKFNATADSWSAKLEQSVWKRQLTIISGVRKNDFDNPIVLQRYNSNTVYKNLTINFRRRNWPSISAGYMPSSQYTVVNNQLFESRYQVLNGTINYQYKIGIAATSTAFMYNRFYNDSRDSGFIYYNSKNFFFSQTFQFALYTANFNISSSSNSQYNLSCLEGGVGTELLKKIKLGLNLKISNLNNSAVKMGFNTSTGFALPGIGDLNIWLEKSYLPNNLNQLYKYEFYNIGFIRYFN